MNIVINTDSVNAALRHVYTAVGAGLAVLTIVGVSQGDQTAIGDAVHKIGDGVASIVAGVATLVPIISAIVASRSASKPSQAAAVAQTPGLQVVPTTPAGQAILDAMPAAAKEANK
jgi:hypothetical protein